MEWRNIWVVAPIAALIVAVLAVGVAAAVASSRVAPVSEDELNRISEAASAASASEEAERPRLLTFLGDSYGGGTGAAGPGRGLADQTAQQMGWRLNNLSQGGTGYVTKGPAGATDRGPFTDRIDQVIGSKPDVVIVAGGLNDMERDYSDDEVTKAVTTTLSGLQAGLPNVPIVVVGPWWGNSFPTTSAVAVDRDVQQVATSLGMPFVSPLQEQWITGSNDGTVPGNRSEYIGPDKTHPSQAGHDYLASRIVAFLRTLPNLPAAVAPVTAGATPSA